MDLMDWLPARLTGGLPQVVDGQHDMGARQDETRRAVCPGPSGSSLDA